MFLFQPIFSSIDFEQDDKKYKVSTLKSKGLYALKLFPLHNLSPVITYFSCKIGCH